MLLLMLSCCVRAQSVELPQQLPDITNGRHGVIIQDRQISRVEAEKMSLETVRALPIIDAAETVLSWQLDALQHITLQRMMLATTDREFKRLRALYLKSRIITQENNDHAGAVMHDIGEINDGLIQGDK